MITYVKLYQIDSGREIERQKKRQWSKEIEISKFTSKERGRDRDKRKKARKLCAASLRTKNGDVTAKPAHSDIYEQ